MSDVPQPRLDAHAALAVTPLRRTLAALVIALVVLMLVATMVVDPVAQG